jgi:UDP-N-acetylglucosamine 2-epimerase (non-hydrolysing)
MNWHGSMQAPDHILVIGTRPEAVKCAPLISAFIRRNARHRLLVVFSGQQPALLDSALPHMEVDIRMPEWPHGLPLKQQRKLVTERLRQLFAELGCGPGTRVIVQGDTSTSYLTALAAKHVGAQLHHVEAGLRSGCLHNPFPEEFHRRAITRLADQHYAPTDGARANLLAEGISAHDILVTGNTGIDGLVATVNGGSRSVPRDVVLISLHRRENHGPAVHQIMRVTMELAKAYPQLQFIWVEHSHPAITKELEVYGRSPAVNLHVRAPLPYAQMVGDSMRYALIMTDSGGMQEEAAHLGIPLMVLRDRTERPEALDPDLGVLCPPGDHDTIITEFGKLIRQKRRPRHVFGDGTAAERIVAHLLAQASVDSTA